MKIRSQTLPAMAIAFALLTAFTPTTAALKGGNPNPGILPPDSHPLGLSYAEWYAKSSQFTLSIPISELPSPVGQFGKVLFPPLALSAPGSNYCAFTIRVGQNLFLPLYNATWVNVPGDPGYGMPWDTPFTDPDTGEAYPTYEAWVRELLKEYMDGGDVGTLNIDGKAVQNLDLYRTQSVLFDVDLPEDNAYGVPAGTYGPCVTDGWCLMLTPLAPGKHTFTAAAGDSFVFVYDITVVPLR